MMLVLFFSASYGLSTPQKNEIKFRTAILLMLKKNPRHAILMHRNYLIYALKLQGDQFENAQI